MNFYLALVLNLVTIVPATIGLARFRKISQAYFPFLIWIWLGTINEIFSVAVVLSGRYNIINTNIFQLFESLIILWQFKRWHLFNNKSYAFLFCLFCLSWTIEVLFISKLFAGFNSYSRILYSFACVLMSVNMINQILMRERKALIKNPQFVICILFVVFFTYAVLVETFWAYGLKMTNEFRANLQHIFVIINLLCNVIFAFVILWMPKRQAFTLQF